MRSDRKHGGLLNGRTLASLGALMLAVCGGPDPGMVSPAAGAHAGGSQRQSLTAAQLAAALRDPSSRVRYEIYQVRSGDTVEDIAARFGVPARQVRRLNDLDAWHQLRAGQSLALMLPTGPAAPAGEASYDLAASAFEPRYARVTAASPIIPEPDVSAAAHPLYIAPAGSQLVVSAEQGECWGVVMIDGSTGWIAKSGVQVSDRTVSTDELDILFKGGRPDIVQEACRYLGTPYPIATGASSRPRWTAHSWCRRRLPHTAFACLALLRRSTTTAGRSALRSCFLAIVSTSSADPGRSTTPASTSGTADSSTLPPGEAVWRWTC